MKILRTPLDRHRSFGLDLVRSVAISLVLISHYGILVPAWLGHAPSYRVASLGSIGVGIFFVLSGFLIGRLLLTLLQNAPTPGELRIFLLRRWMRTVPLYVVWLCISLVFFPPDGNPLWYFFRYVTFSQNLAWPMPSSNWFPVSWSLTVEEWFYVLFSGCVILCARFQSGMAAMWSVLVLFLIVPAALRWQVPDSADWTDVVTKVAVYRLDSIAYGVLLAVVFTAWPHLFRRSALLATLGATIVVGAWAVTTNYSLIVPLHVFRTFYFNILDLGAALWIAGLGAWVTCRGPFGSLVRGLSEISYGLYLMHLSILQSVQHWLPYGFWEAIGGAALITVGLAILSWRYFEQPILRRRPKHAFLDRSVTPRLVTRQAD